MVWIERDFYPGANSLTGQGYACRCFAKAPVALLLYFARSSLALGRYREKF